jgi:hypothetical protein
VSEPCLVCGRSNADMAALIAENEQLRAEKAELRDALEDLMDWQNGPPLSSYKWVTGWGDAMATAERLLAYHGRQEVTP